MRTGIINHYVLFYTRLVAESSLSTDNRSRPTPDKSCTSANLIRPHSIRYDFYGIICNREEINHLLAKYSKHPREYTRLYMNLRHAKL
ncbi:AAEL004801-PA [Aedes aegypti]|uniref:AAEL004801-PA n=1 Tax=Aedes aegypti TaxID=7159 RepID=Q17BW1_AEDAE|nr:AAEL004801-PA [Aedes aegypti]